MTLSTSTAPATRTHTGDRRFPADFTWGTATAAYQIEGAATEDGRGPSIWDTFSHTPGKVAHGHTGDEACDHYHRMPEDVALMSELGIGSYRFSVSWARVRPNGGPVNPAGLAFYDRLVDELLSHDIEPLLTLYHWDLPQALEDTGGWTSRDTAFKFAEYAGSVHDALGDRVPTWTTFNEPWCSAFLGYADGHHAPGRKEPASAMRAVHHLLLAHGLATTELRSRGADRLGITLNFTVADPADPSSPADLDAARRIDGLHNRVFLEPIVRGAYPADVVADTEHLGWTDVVQDGDLETISTPIDVLGVNYYQGDAVAGAAPDAAPAVPGSTPFVCAEDVVFVQRGMPQTAMGWDVQPEGLTRLLLRLRDEAPGLELMVTENGAAYDDVVEADGSVDDQDRLSFIEQHLHAVLDAREQGADVRGYYVWSFLDNFEWAHGYDRRFGIVRVDYETQQRTPKSSGLWYADVCRTGLLPGTDG